MTSRSSGFNRNGFFGFGARLGGLSVVAVLALAPVTTPAYADCFGDLTGPAGILDGTVGTEDLQAVISSWGHYQSAADLDGDISTPVGIHDLLLLLDAWGDCPNPCDQNPCQEGCTYNPCDLFGPCYDYSACFDMRCAEDPCYAWGCPGYDDCDCGWGDPCYCWGDCGGWDDCWIEDPCNPMCMSWDPCDSSCPDYDPCDPNCPGYDPCDPWCPGYDPCAPCCFLRLESVVRQSEVQGG